MQHDVAKSVFERIREQPYLVSTEQGQVAPNCFFKGCQLINDLSVLGYGVRGRTAEMDWTRTPLPTEITDLIPDDVLQLHFYPEVLIDGEWRILDPSIDPETAKLGFKMVEFENEEGKCCFATNNVCSLEEQIVMFKKISEPAYLDNYFSRSRLFLEAINDWLIEQRGGI